MDQNLISQKIREELEETYLEADVPSKLIFPASNTVPSKFYVFKKF